MDSDLPRHAASPSPPRSRATAPASRWSASAACRPCAKAWRRATRTAPASSVRAGYGAAVAALQAHVEAGSVDVVLAAGSNGAYLRDNLNVPVVMVKVNGFDVLRAITQAVAARPAPTSARCCTNPSPRAGRARRPAQRRPAAARLPLHRRGAHGGGRAGRRGLQRHHRPRHGLRLRPAGRPGKRLPHSLGRWRRLSSARWSWPA